jgi:hypothetical protein
MVIAVWIASALLAALYLAAGGMKAFAPIERLNAQMGWTTVTGPRLTRVIGIVEVLGAIGVILPHLTGILPWLSVVAAFGLALVQLLAIGFHIRQKDDPKRMPMNVVLLVLALFVGIGLLFVL